MKVKCKLEYLPHAFNEKLFYKYNDVPIGYRKINALFVGVGDKKRNQKLSGLKEKCIIYGKGWDKKSLKRHFVSNKRISLKKMVEFYNETNIAICIRSVANNINGLNMRPFEAAACGCLIAIDKNKDISLCYEPDKEVVVYKNHKELDSIIRRMRNKDKELIKIAENGYNRAMRDHGYKKRMQHLLDVVFKDKK
jgi:spore maturation protein CgeB